VHVHVSEVSQNIVILYHIANVVVKTVLFWKIWQIKWHFLFERGEQQNFSAVCNAGDIQVRQLLSWHGTLSLAYGVTVFYNSECKKKYSLHSN